MVLIWALKWSQYLVKRLLSLWIFGCSSGLTLIFFQCNKSMYIYQDSESYLAYPLGWVADKKEKYFVQHWTKQIALCSRIYCWLLKFFNQSFDLIGLSIIYCNFIAGIANSWSYRSLTNVVYKCWNKNLYNSIKFLERKKEESIERPILLKKLLFT